MHVGHHGFVHAGNLHLIIEVRAIAQAANHDGRTSLLCRGDRELVIAGAIELTTGLGRNRRKHLAHHLEAFLHREQRFFTRVHPDRDNQTVAQPNGAPEHVQMAIGDGIEGAGIERDARHKPLYPAPGGRASGAAYPSRAAYAGSALNQFRTSGVSQAGGSCFVALIATKQNSPRTKPFRTGAKTSGNGCFVPRVNEAVGRKGPMTGAPS